MKPNNKRTKMVVLAETRRITLGDLAHDGHIYGIQGEVQVKSLQKLRKAELVSLVCGLITELQHNDRVEKNSHSQALYGRDCYGR